MQPVIAAPSRPSLHVALADSPRRRVDRLGLLVLLVRAEEAVSGEAYWIERPHWVKIRLLCVDGVTILSTDGGRRPQPWKWKAECVCGWTALSWAWDRRHEDPPGKGGAVPMALEHVGLLSLFRNDL